MTKRQKLDYNSDELAHHLAQSKGQGVDALFSPPSPPLPTRTMEQQVHEKAGKSKKVRKRVHTHAPHDTQTTLSEDESAQAHTDISVHARTAEELKRGFLDRRHLSSFTFRFKAKELEDLDRVSGEVDKGTSQKVSKNDVVRLALNWLLKDYEKDKGKSMLASVVRSV